MRAAIRAEVFKSVRRRMTYVLLSISSALIALYYFLLWLQIRHQPLRRRAFIHWLSLRSGMSFANAIPYGLQLERFFVTLVAVAFAATMMANEYNWHTAEQALARGVRRRDFLAGKLVVAAGFAAVATIVTFSVGLALSAWWSHLYSLPFGPIDAARLAHALASLARNYFVILPFVALGLLCATIWRSAPQAAGFALGLFFLEAVFTGLLTDAKGILPHVPEALLNVNIIAVIADNGAVHDSWVTGPLGLAIGQSDVPMMRAVAVVSCWIAALVGIAFWRFSRRDMTA